MKQELKINSRFVYGSLRNCGYTNYSAIADIIDNSIEEEVDASYVKVYTEKEKGETSRIAICDDGTGMNKSTLKEAMSLGSETGKSADKNLGLYGTGLKTASLSIGQCLTVLTKSEENGLISATLDISNTEDKEIFVDFEEELSEELKSLADKYIPTSTGTAVIISKLDRVSNKDYYQFADTITSKIGLMFYHIMLENDIKFYVNDKKVEPKNPIGDKAERISGAGESFEYDGQRIKYIAYFVPRGLDDIDEKDNIRRTAGNSGLYIYRQNRLVGKALNFGLLGKSGYHDTWFNGFRCELFIDGSCDKIFNSTFTKMISEKDESSLDQSFKDIMFNAIRPYVLQSGYKEKEYSKDAKDNKELKKTLERVTKKQNENKLLRPTVGFGINEKPGNSQPKNPNPKPQKNPAKTRKRNDAWLGGFEFESMGKSEEMYKTKIADGKVYCVLNTDHPFYIDFFSQQPQDVQEVIAMLFSCQYQALQKCGYYTNEDAENIINEYNFQISEKMRQSMMY